MAGYVQDGGGTAPSGAAPSIEGGAPRLSRVLRKELGISILINIAFNLTFALLLFDTSARIPLWGHVGIAADLLPATFMPALMMTFGITLGMQRRIRQGRIMPLAPALPAIFLPRILPLRALTIALLAVLVIVPPVLAIVALSWTGPWSWGGFVAFKLAFSVVHAALVTPVVVVSTLRCSR